MPVNANDILKELDETGSSQGGPGAVPYSDDYAPAVSDPAPVPQQSWGQMGSDIGRLGVGAVESQIGSAAKWIGSTVDDPSIRAAYQGFGEDWTKSGQAWTGSVSPGGQQITEAPLFSSTTLEHPLSKTLMGTAKGGLWNLAMIPGGGVGGMVARGALGATLGYTGAYGGVSDAIDAQPDNQLQQNSPTYMELRKTLPEYDAKQVLADQAWGNISHVEKAAIVGTSALAGEAGPLATVGKTISGTGTRQLIKAGTNRWTQAAIGAAETGGVQAGQYLGTAIPTREALTSVGAPADTTGQIAVGAAEQMAMGAVIGGGARAIRKPVGGAYEAGKDPGGRGEVGGAQVGEVPAGHPDPAAAQALSSAIGQQQELPLTGGRGQAPPPGPTPPPPPTPPRGPYQQPLPLNYWRSPGPTETPIPPRPTGRPPPDVTAPRPGELPLEQPGQPPQRQGELPLQAPQPPVQQASLDLGAPRQPVTQLGLPGMGRGEVIQPGETIPRLPEAAPKPPEPTPAPTPAPAPTKGPKAPVTKVSEPEPTVAAPEGVKDRIQNVVDAHPTPEGEQTDTLRDRKAIQARAASIDDKITPQDKAAALRLPKEEIPIKSYIISANVLANEKVPTANSIKNFINNEKQVRDHFEGPKEPVTKVSEPPSASAGKISFEALKAKVGKPVEVPPTEAPPITKAEARRQAAIAKLVEKKAAPTQVERPTAEPPTEPKVTVLPSGMPAYTRIEPGEKAKAIVAKFAPKGEEEPPPKVPATKLKSLSQLKAALAKKAGEEPVTTTGKVAAAIKGVLPPEVPATKKGEMKAAAERVKGRIAQARDKIIKSIESASPKQLAAGNYEMEHPDPADTQGVRVTVTGPGGLKDDAVGRIKGTTVDNIPHKPLDAILASEKDNGLYHVVNRLENGRFKDHVVVLGADDVGHAYEHAIADVQKNNPGMSRSEAIDHIGGIVEYTKPEFEHWLENGDRNQLAYPLPEGHPEGVVQQQTGPYLTLGSSTLHTALQDTMNHMANMDEYKPLYNIYKWWSDNVSKHIPNVPVYYAKQGDVHNMSGSEGTDAFYNRALNHIVIGDAMDNPPEIALLHEAGHAVTSHLYNGDKIFRDLVDRTHEEYMQGLLDRRESPATSNVEKGGEELIADWVNPEVARQLYETKMSSELARDLNMDEWKGAPKTLWNGIIKAFGDAMERMFGVRLPGGENKYSLLDGIMRLNDAAFMARSKNARTDFANIFRAAKVHSGDIFKKIDSERNTQGDIIKTIRNASSHPDNAEEMVAERGNSISDRAEDLLDKVGRGRGTSAYYGLVSKLMTTDTFRMANEKFFGKLDENNSLRKYVEKTLQRARDFEERLNVKREFVAKMGKATADIGKQEANKLSDVLSKATAYRFDPRSPMGEGMNGWLKTAADRIAKAREKGEDDPNLFYKHQQAINKSDEITKDFNALHPLAQQWFGRLVDDYAAKGRERAEIAVDALVHTIDSEGPKFITEPKLDPNDPASRDRIEYAKYHNDFEQNWDKNKAGLRQRILDDSLTENDKEWLANRGIDTTDDIHTLSVPKGPYVPLDHAGDWIINARYKIDTPTNAKQINDNTFEFKTREAMQDFLDKQPPNSRPYVVHYNDEGEQVPKWEKWQNKDGSIGLAKDNKAWRVEVNDKYYSGHDNLTSANRRFKELQDTGAFAKIAEPQMKQAGWYPQLEIASPLFKKLIASIDKRTDYTEDQKAAVKQLLKDTAIGSMEGNRIAKTLLPRKLVAGWDTDFIKTYDKYADMHNALMSRNKYAKDMGAIKNEMVKHAKDNEFSPGATERSAVLSELHDRDNFFGAPDYVGGEDSKLGKTLAPVLRKAGTLSFLNHMVSVGHVITHSTHQIITADLVAAKYGGFGTMGEAARLHSVLAGAGFRNAWKSIPEAIKVITKDSKGLNYVEDLMDALQKHRYGAELKDLIDKAIETGRVHPDQGFDTSIYHMTSGKLDAWLSKVDRMARQTLGAVEAYNRVWGHALAYVRARENGESIEQATRSSFDMVSESQGLLSRANMSPIMSKWYMRPTMQFRGWGMNMMMNICRTFYNAFKGETKDAKAEAWRRLAYLFGTTAALTGVNGLPSDPMRISLALAGALGITNYNWSDAQNAIREKLAEMGGPGFATLAMDGLLGSMGPFGFFGADRIGFGSLLVFGEPQSASKADFSAWMWGLVGGAPGQTVPNAIKGVSKLQQGDYAGAIHDLVPLKIIDDWALAWRGATVGVPTQTGVPGMMPYSTGETIMQGIGLIPARQERYREARTAELRAEQATRDETSQLLNALGQARTEPDRVKARMQIAAYNLRNPQDRITPQDVMKAQRRATAPSGLGKTLTKAKRARIQSLEQSYGAY
jgi:hypothetical protein